MTWQPIETAPEDAWVYTWGPSEGHGISRHCWGLDPPFGGATHWMPLPTPPLASGGDVG